MYPPSTGRNSEVAYSKKPGLTAWLKEKKLSFESLKKNSNLRNFEFINFFTIFHWRWGSHKGSQWIDWQKPINHHYYLFILIVRWTSYSLETNLSKIRKKYSPILTTQIIFSNLLQKQKCSVKVKTIRKCTEILLVWEKNFNSRREQNLCENIISVNIFIAICRSFKLSHRKKSLFDRVVFGIRSVLLSRVMTHFFSALYTKF